MQFDLIATADFLDKKLTALVKVANLFDAKIFSLHYTGSDGYDVQWQGRTLRFSTNYRF